MTIPIYIREVSEQLRQINQCKNLVDYGHLGQFECCVDGLCLTCRQTLINLMFWGEHFDDMVSNIRTSVADVNNQTPVDTNEPSDNSGE